MALSAPDAGAQSSADPWPIAGHDLANTRSQPSEQTINVGNAGSLTTKWIFQTGGDVSATPTVGADAVFFPDWAGNLYAVDKSSGKAIWSKQISTYTGVAGAVSRVSPALFGPDLIIGDIASTKLHDGARVIAINRQTGALHWMTQVEKHGAAVITGSPVIANGMVLVGVSSLEESLADTSNYPCCTFRGSLVALDAATGKLMWQTYMAPDKGGKTGGYSGNAIWQPPAVDLGRGIVYVGAGNNYTVPDSVAACEKNVAGGLEPCNDPANYFDTALALDLRTGTVLWNKQLHGYDVWTVACANFKPGTTCPSPAGPDFDLGGAGPNLVGSFVGFGQKSGVYWNLDTATGNVAWGTQLGPGSSLGGIEWGSATDGNLIFAAISNSLHNTYQLKPNGSTISWGSWGAINLQTGQIAWQTADPSAGAIDPGAVSVANGVVFAGSLTGIMYAMDAQTGKILWTFQSGGAVIDGPSIADGVVYWGSGYSKIPPGKSNNQLFAFTPAK